VPSSCTLSIKRRSDETMPSTRSFSWRASFAFSRARARQRRAVLGRRQKRPVRNAKWYRRRPPPGTKACSCEACRETIASSPPEPRRLPRVATALRPRKQNTRPLEGLKLRAANLARPTKKCEPLRAGFAALAEMNDKAFIAALRAGRRCRRKGSRHSASWA
jgi:hypothetical protein